MKIPASKQEGSFHGKKRSNKRGLDGSSLPSSECPFTILGISKNGASRKEVLKAWRRRMKVSHSDKTGDGDDTAAKVLNDAKERALHLRPNAQIILRSGWTKTPSRKTYSDWWGMVVTDTDWERGNTSYDIQIRSEAGALSDRAFDRQGARQAVVEQNEVLGFHASPTPSAHLSAKFQIHRILINPNRSPM
jgi:curved DNA-binding protein CbpA